MKRFVQIISHPNKEDKMIDGAKTLIPVERPRWSKNKKEVSVLVLPSNLFSRNS
jgi:hypothetical protein